MAEAGGAGSTGTLPPRPACLLRVLRWGPHPYPGRSTRYHESLIKKWLMHRVLPAEAITKQSPQQRWRR